MTYPARPRLVAVYEARISVKLQIGKSTLNIFTADRAGDGLKQQPRVITREKGDLELVTILLTMAMLFHQ